MVTKIALIGARLSTNLGGPSLALSTQKALNTFFHNADYTLFVPPNSYEGDNVLAPRYDVEIAPFCMSKWSPFLALIRRCTGILVGPASVKATIKELEETDVIIDIWGILFADAIGGITFRSRMSGGFRFILGKILGKPVIKYTADLGPFNYKWNRIFAKLYLGHFIDLILARDEASRQYVEMLGVKRPILTVADTAFLLPSIESNQSKHYEALGKVIPLIGLSVSFQARNRATILTKDDVITYHRRAMPELRACSDVSPSQSEVCATDIVAIEAVAKVTEIYRLGAGLVYGVCDP